MFGKYKELSVSLSSNLLNHTMQTEELVIERLGEYIPLLKDVLNEYREELNYAYEDELLALLSDIKKSWTEGDLTGFSLKKICSILNSLQIDRLSDFKYTHPQLHSVEPYHSLLDRIFTHSVFLDKTYYLLKSIGFAKSNVVLIGANGSGKTTFANSIREQLEATDNGIVIPAQKLLVFPTYTVIPSHKNASAHFYQRQKEVLDDKKTFDAAKPDDFPYELSKKYGSELMTLTSYLLGDRSARFSRYCTTVNEGDVVKKSDFRSILDDVMEVWNNLIEHRTLYCDDSFNLHIKYDDKSYPAYKMSDGEREIFYVVGRVLSAKESSLIVIDEPELHLHKAILNKLWDTLENKRNDCLFVYLTHDVDFASTRNAKRCWLKSYNAGVFEHWDIEPVISDEIPEALLMRLLGSRKKILFCEGKDGSLDRSIFEAIFPDFTITPVATCKDVINYTRAFNKIKTKYAEAYGLIDRDFRDGAQLEKLETENVFSYDVAEVENLFLLEDFINGFAVFKNEEINVDEIKSRVLRMLENEVEKQAALYVSSCIDFYFKESHLNKGLTKDDINNNFQQFISGIQIEKWYSDRINELNAIIINKDYRKAIMVFNHKGLHSAVESVMGIKSYSKRAIDYLRRCEEAKSALREVFPAILLK